VPRTRAPTVTPPFDSPGIMADFRIHDMERSLRREVANVDPCRRRGLVFASALLLVPLACRAETRPPTHGARGTPGTVYRIHPELFGAGLAVFGTTYTLSVAAATIASSDAVKSCALPSKRDCPNPLQPLFLPVLGPFWMMGRIQPPGSREYGSREYGQIAYFTLGMAQFAGLTAMVLGSFRDSKRATASPSPWPQPQEERTERGSA
jgi:hypothetical protein